MNRRILFLSSAGAIAALSLAACSASPSASTSSPSSIAVVASTNVWGDIASTIGGQHVTVTSIINDPSKDPHEYQADAQTQLQLSKAQIVIENGGGYDDFVDTMLSSLNNSSVVKLNAVDISGKKAAAGADLNEHVWYDFPTVEKVIDKVEAAYSRIDPTDKAVFEKNATDLKSKIDALITKEAGVKTAHTGDGVTITEPVPLYMLEAMGLENKTPAAFSKAIEDGTDVAPAVLRETLDLYSSHAVKLLAYNEQTSGPQTEAVLKAAKDNAIPVVPVTETLPSGKDYVAWMTDNVDAISTALAK